MGYVSKTTKDGKVVKLKNYKRRVKINRIKRKLFLVMFLLIILAIILLFAPFMQIKKINCSGNAVVQTDEIISSSKIVVGDNIFRINKKRAIDSIDDNPYIKTVKIDRKLPSTINILVEECQVRAYIEKNKQYIYIDENGKVLEISDKLPPKNIPVIKGVNVTKCDVNEVVEFKNANQIDNLKSIISEVLESEFNGLVTTIDIKDEKNNKIIVNDKLEIILGNAENLEYKINYMAKGAYESLGHKGTGTLDVSYGSKAVYKEKH